MKIAILSDIHGNVLALESVLNAVKKRGIDTLVIAGDFVGYYFWPVEVFNLLNDYGHSKSLTIPIQKYKIIVLFIQILIIILLYIYNILDIIFSITINYTIFKNII